MLLEDQDLWEQTTRLELELLREMRNINLVE